MLGRLQCTKRELDQGYLRYDPGADYRYMLLLCCIVLKRRKHIKKGTSVRWSRWQWCFDSLCTNIYTDRRSSLRSTRVLFSKTASNRRQPRIVLYPSPMLPPHLSRGGSHYASSHSSAHAALHSPVPSGWGNTSSS